MYKINDDEFITDLTNEKIDELLEEQKALIKANKDKNKVKKEIHELCIWFGQRLENIQNRQQNMMNVAKLSVNGRSQKMVKKTYMQIGLKF